MPMLGVVSLPNPGAELNVLLYLPPREVMSDLLLGFNGRIQFFRLEKGSERLRDLGAFSLAK